MDWKKVSLNSPCCFVEQWIQDLVGLLLDSYTSLMSYDFFTIQQIKSRPAKRKTARHLYSNSGMPWLESL